MRAEELVEAGHTAREEIEAATLSGSSSQKHVTELSQHVAFLESKLAALQLHASRWQNEKAALEVSCFLCLQDGCSSVSGTAFSMEKPSRALS